MDILVTVKRQKLIITSNLRPIVSGSQKFVHFLFDLDDSWENLTVFAQFTQNGTAYNQYLDEDNCCYLPSEIVEGKCTLMIYGTGDEVIGTSNYITLTIDANALVADAQSTVIAKSLYTQLVAKVKLLEAEAKERYGSPLTASTASGMTDTSRVYVYTGNESGYKNGYWYYYKNGKWNEGGAYNSIAVPDEISAKIDTVEETLMEVATNAAQTAEEAIERVDATDERVSELESNLETSKTALSDMITSVSQTAATALSTANSADNRIAELDNEIDAIYAELQNVSIDPDDLGLYQDMDTYYVYPTYRGVRSENGIPLSGAGGGGGGGGGGDIISAVLSVENTTGWLSKTIADGAPCEVSFTWSSIENEMPTGDGNMRITVNDVVRASIQIAQGNVSIDLSPYLSSGTNKVKIRISDAYDQGKTTTFTITSVALSISSTFDTTQPYTSTFTFPCTPVGNIEKTIHVLIDDREVVTQTTSLSGRQLNLVIPAQSHGGHSLKAYFTAIINGETVSSNTLYYEFIFLVPLNNTVVITSSFNKDSVAQYSSVPIPYTVYNPASLSSEVNIYINNVLSSTQTVDRTEQSYTVKVNTPGTVTVRIESGGTTKTVQFTVVESEIDVKAETQDLALHLTAQGRSNNEEHPEIWEDGNIYAVLSGFTWRLDGWQTDGDSINVLRLIDEARVTIPYKIFGTDFKGTGKTVEIEFSTHDVIDYNATILSCMSDGIGLKITPQMVEFAGAQTNLSTVYKDNEHLRLSIVVEKQSENRLILVYINGIMSRAIQYASGERFSQLNPVDISIGSDSCGIDIYNIRVYDNDLNRQQVLDNWIADTQVGSVMLERFTRNNVYDAYGAITPSNLLASMPYFIIECPELPQFKGDEKTVSGSFTNVMYPSRSFTFDGCVINAQGTSSSVYYVKNIDMKFKNGFVTSNGTVKNYALRPGSIPFNRFVMKADVASIESWNNTGLTMFYNDTCPYKTPEMKANDKVRWGIEGIPVVGFWHNTETGETSFIGKYNFNLPKRAPAPYGYGDDDTLESWEWERNNSANVKFQDNDFTSESWDETKQEYYPTWYDDFEARFPSDEFRDVTQLNEFLAWVKSTWRDEATNEDLTQPVTYTLSTKTTLTAYGDDTSYTVTERKEGDSTVYDITFTKDTPAYRLTKFRAEFGNYAEIQSALFYYLFTEEFLMIDSRAKNMFIGFNGSTVA